MLLWAAPAWATCTSPCIAAVSAESPDGNGFTSGAIDTTGATLLILAFPDIVVGTATVTDSKSNAWACRNTLAEVAVNICYAYDTTKVGAGHTFTINGASTFASMAVAAFSGTKTSADPLDQESSATDASGTATTLAPGANDPTDDNALVIQAFMWGHLTTVSSIGDSFTITHQTTYNGSFHGPVALAYKVQATGSTNPTWTVGSSASTLYARSASFRNAPAAGGPPVGSLMMLGVGR